MTTKSFKMLTYLIRSVTGCSKELLRLRESLKILISDMLKEIIQDYKMCT